MRLPIHKSILIEQLLKQEDTTGSFTITIDDLGRKKFIINNEKGHKIVLRGTYHLSNLLQEVSLLPQEKGNIFLQHIIEEPVKRISRVIKDFYWTKLTRNFDKEGLLNVLEDEKMQGDFLRLYVPESDVDALAFYKNITALYKNVKVETISEDISNEDAIALNKKPGILTLAYSKENKKSVPFVVPGGRFNEMYGWDSYFIGIGLIIDDKFELAKAMIDNLEYQIIHYGKILNANRSYYLSRSQPPFFTSFIKEFYESYSNKLQVDWLQQKLTSAISEYFNVWMTKNVRLTNTQLNRYFGEGTGIPNETEPNHFDNIFKIFAEKYNISFIEFREKYKRKEIIDEDLDKYFIHDRSMRESGHDTTSRLDNCSAHLNTVDLNSLLYKYECDISYLIITYFNGVFKYNNDYLTSDVWLRKAKKRREIMLNLMWNEEESTFYDYNFVKKQQQPCISASNLYPLWANLCTQKQARKIANNQLSKLICKGGIVSTSHLEATSSSQPKRQWDFPYGWAPHQMLIWQGLNNYNMEKKSQELIYRWLWLIVKTVVNYNGLIPEKFDVNKCTHKINVEYGNVGSNFKYVPDGGFGWTNASFKLGLKLLEDSYVDNLNSLKDPDEIFVEN
ncbi:trehalase family glycosidase [Lutibacter sp.]